MESGGSDSLLQLGLVTHCSRAQETSWDFHQGPVTSAPCSEDGPPEVHKQSTPVRGTILLGWDASPQGQHHLLLLSILFCFPSDERGVCP